MRKSAMCGFYMLTQLAPTIERPGFTKYGPTAYGGAVSRCRYPSIRDTFPAPLLLADGPEI